MEEMIVVQLNPTQTKQIIYVISNNSEEVPHKIESSIDELNSQVAMAAAKYNIRYIKLAGATDYTTGIRNSLTEKINTCFGKNNNFIIELM